MRVALTGGAACGKSTATAEFAKLGWRTLSADKLAHEVLEMPEVAALVREAFGAGVFTADGRVCRSALARVVFGDTAARKTLESFVHPRVNALWRNHLAAAPRERWMVEIPLLFEAGLEPEFDTVVCVHCTPATQLARLASRTLSPSECRALLAAQLPLDEKVRRSPRAIFNEGTPAFLTAQVRQIDPEIQKTGKQFYC